MGECSHAGLSVSAFLPNPFSSATFSSPSGLELAQGDINTASRITMTKATPRKIHRPICLLENSLFNCTDITPPPLPLELKRSDAPCRRPPGRAATEAQPSAPQWL